MLSWTRPAPLLSVWGFFTGVCSGSVWVSQVFLLFVWRSGRVDLSSCAAEHKHEFCWLCWSLCVYVANCEMTCCGIQREDCRASPVHPRSTAETWEMTSSSLPLVVFSTWEHYHSSCYRVSWPAQINHFTFVSRKEQVLFVCQKEPWSDTHIDTADTDNIWPRGRLNMNTHC